MWLISGPETAKYQLNATISQSILLFPCIYYLNTAKKSTSYRFFQTVSIAPLPTKYLFEKTLLKVTI